MSMKVQIKDYQIIKKASLEFIPGLNVIVGPSNNGKSSLLKAIKSSLYTTPGTTPIRAGQTSYAVGISYNNHTVILQKGMKESVYMVDGEKYTKFGTTTPEAVSNALNIKELTLNGNKEQLNFWDQMNYPFLLDKSAVELFRFIIDSGDNDQISKALKSMVSDRQGLSKEIDQLQGSINTVDQDIELLEKNIEQAGPILEACTKVLELQSQVAKLNRLIEIKNQINTINSQKTELKDKYDLSISTVKLWRDFQGALKPVLERFIDLRGKFIRLHNLIGDMADLDENRAILESIKNLKPIDTTKLNNLLTIKTALHNIETRKKSINLQPVITCNYSKEDYTKLQKLKEHLIAYKNRQETKTKYDQNISNLKNIITANKELKDLFDICPVCGNKIH